MLRRGELFGATTARLDLDDAMLTEASFAPGTSLPAHTHELPNFLLVVDGSFDEAFGRHERTCGPRRLFFRPPGERHSQRFLARGATCLTIELPASVHEGRLRDADGRLRLDGAPALSACRVYDELRCATRDTPLVVEELVADLVALAAGRTAIAERHAPRWLDVAREAIDARLDGTVRLADIARDVGVHRVHLSRTFRRFLGCGVAEYVRRLRVHRACARLRVGPDRASAVAAETGFSDESHMGRAFRAVMRCTPREYRSGASMTATPQTTAKR